MLNEKSLTKLLREHINKMLKEKKIEVLEKKPKNLRINKYLMGISEQFMAEQGKQTTIKILTNTLHDIIFSDYQEEMRAGVYPHYAIYFLDEPSVLSDKEKSLYVVKFRFGSYVKSRKKIKNKLAVPPGQNHNKRHKKHAKNRD